MRLLGDWLAAYPDAPVLASGMVGSRHGWRETPYVSCPAELAVLVGKLAAVEAEGRRVWLAPGLSCEDETGQPDVMRGEEVEILGMAEVGARLVVLPGSHSKWAAMGEGCVLRFRTFVTGELFAALRDHTLAGAFAREAKPGPIGAAFAFGVTGGAAAVRGDKKGGLLGALFGARSLPLMGKLPDEDASDYLSGLLIGAEIEEARRLFLNAEPYVAGAETLVGRYLAAFAALGLQARAAPPKAAARGLFVLARAAGLTMASSQKCGRPRVKCGI